MRRPRAKPLTEAMIKRLQALADEGPRTEYSDSGNPGLRLRIGPRSASWSLFLQLNGQRSRHALGEWPDVGVDEARRRAKRLQQETKHSRTTPATLADLLADYAALKGPSLRRNRSTINSLKDAIASIRHRHPATLSRRDIATIVARKAKTAPSHANRQLAYLKALFNWAIAQGLMETNPALGVGKPARESPRERTPTMEEIAAIWTAAALRPHPYGPIVQMLILTACRRQEVAEMRWSELRLPPQSKVGEWIIPASRTKNGRAIRIPLSASAREIIEAAELYQINDLVFATFSGSPFQSWSKAKIALDRVINTNSSKPLEWTHHDLRRSFATYACDDLDALPEVVDRCLNHVGAATSSTVARVYARGALFDQRRNVLEAWSEAILDAVDRY